ncbi:MAG: MarR family transcriptional regulator [Ruminococcus sp.]|nr:MarR family transcriptional regulator [Ruminococcus sp.]
MSASKYTEEFFDALRIAYYGDEAGMLSEYLRGECRLLLYLNISEEQSVQPGKLAEKLGISTARVASILKSLENKGMIERHCGTADKRKVFVTITKKGSDYIDAKRGNITGFFDRRFGMLTENERVEFIKIVRKLAVHDAAEEENNGQGVLANVSQ